MVFTFLNVWEEKSKEESYFKPCENYVNFKTQHLIGAQPRSFVYLLPLAAFAKAEACSYGRDHVAHKIWNIYYLVLYWESFLTPDLEN